PEIHVSVQDEGVSIATEDQRRIYKRFTLDEGDRESGTGLSLSIAASIAEGHGGAVRLCSVAVGGSSLTIVVPQFTQSPSADPEHRAGPGPTNPTAAGDTGERGPGPADTDDRTARRGNDG